MMNAPKTKTPKSKTNKQNKQKSATTTKRQWQLLSELKRKAWTGTKSLQTKLKNAGFDVSLRTIQRDLNQLAERFPIESNGENPQGWRWKDNAPQQSLPQMSLSEAVAFHLVEENLKQILPESFLKEMHPWFNMAKSQLASNKHTGSWLNSIRIIPATQPLIGARIKPHVQDVIYEALFEQKQITASYRPRILSEEPKEEKPLEKTQTKENKQVKKKPSDGLKRYILNPIALVQRGVVLYLICSKEDKDKKHPTKHKKDTPKENTQKINKPDDIRMFALHRFEYCKKQSTPSTIPKDFNLDKYLDEGKMGFSHPNLENKPTPIRLVFKPKTAKTLQENRLSLDQENTTDTEGNVVITATVSLNHQLVWWLRSFGKGLLSIEPENLATVVWEE